jgi:hypothetical protein
MISLKNRLKKFVEDPVYVHLYKVLELNVSPEDVKYYSFPYQDRMKSLSVAKSPYQKLKCYLDLKRAPFVIPKDKNISLMLYEEDEDIYQFILNLWENDFDYTQNPYYKSLKLRMNGSKPVRRKGFNFKTEKDLEEFFKRYEILLKSMSKNGYNSNLKQDELLVWIGSDGGLIKSIAGRHRMAAAKIVGAPFVPVRIRHIHQGWIEKVLERDVPAPKNLTIEELLHVVRKTKEKYSVTIETDSTLEAENRPY